ncbi:UNVERIFIED_CONTAM: Transcription factor [Sesamum angustifolium]|uniref:Transcription factor n=1 Tax=Sesamum angustifolium TaxID=2727405 RepID=A0AAW2M9F8_9LAMI
MKKMENNSSNTDANNGKVLKQKERHIVSWSQEVNFQLIDYLFNLISTLPVAGLYHGVDYLNRTWMFGSQEDDILREQIRLHGTENWAIIASKFKDKTTRQCRRRWFTYLNSDFKRGGWSPEEDMLLCEAQKIFGNRWTEIAKMVSGRTDNAVKNRFTTLCKKRAKREALVKENSTTSYINLNNKRVISRNGLNADGGSESAGPLKKIRTNVSSTTENFKQGEKLAGEYGVSDHLLRPPFAVLAQRVHSCECTFNSKHKDDIFSFVRAATNNKTQKTFLEKDDPKLLALMQQAELLSSLAVKVNTEKTDQSLENAWMVLQDFLKQNNENDLLTTRNSDTDFQLEKFKELVEDLRSSNQGSRSSWRDHDVYESSPASSEYSSGSTLLSNAAGDKTEECEAVVCLLHQETGQEFLSEQLDPNSAAEENGICHTASTNEVENMLTCNDVKADNEAVCVYSNNEFNSPLHVTPLFRALAATIPSPKFSESEKHFLMKTLGMESTSPSPITNPSQPPPCKRSLLLVYDHSHSSTLHMILCRVQESPRLSIRSFRG